MAIEIEKRHEKAKVRYKIDNEQIQRGKNNNNINV